MERIIAEMNGYRKRHVSGIRTTEKIRKDTVDFVFIMREKSTNRTRADCHAVDVTQALT